VKGRQRRKTDLVHLPFGIYCPEDDRYLTDHFAIHVLQLKKWPLDVKIEDDKGRWISFFKHGKDLDPDNLPGWMETPAMREAMSVLRKFTEQEENYHLYLSRLDERREKQTVERLYKEMEAKLKNKTAEAEHMAAEVKSKNAEAEHMAAKLKSKTAEVKTLKNRDQALETEVQHLRERMKQAGLDPDS